MAEILFLNRQKMKKHLGDLMEISVTGVMPTLFRLLEGRMSAVRHCA